MIRRPRSAYRVLLSLGLLSFGLVHLVIGGLAFYLVLGMNATASYSGALRAVAGRPLGGVLMWAMAIGLGTLTVWQVAWAITWRERHERWTRPIGALGRAATYAVLALLSLSTILASGEIRTSGEPSSDTAAWSVRLVDSTVGRVMIIILAVVVGAVGVAKVGRGIRRTFREDLWGAVGRPTVVIGVIGHIAKGLVLVAMGLLLLFAAVTRKASDVGGIDLALTRLSENRFGSLVLIGIGIGLACYGIYCLIWSTRARVAGESTPQRQGEQRNEAADHADASDPED